MNRKVLLVVEDNPDDEALVRRALKKGSVECDIVVVQDGAEAVEYLLGGDDAGRWSKPPDLVLLDLKTPRLDGFDVLKRLRAEDRTRSMPVVVFTSSGEESDKQRSYDLGANAYVRKPIEAEHFSQTVRDLAAFWIGLNEVSPLSPDIGVAHRSIIH